MRDNFKVSMLWCIHVGCGAVLYVLLPTRTICCVSHVLSLRHICNARAAALLRLL